MNKKKITVETYNRTATEMAAKFNKVGARVKDIKKAFSYIEKPNPKVVELGCGNGRDAREILKLTSDYVGIDISEEMIKLARLEAPDAKFEVADFETYVFPPNIDIIFASASLLHTDKENLRKILKRAAETLNRGGVFFISLIHDNYHELVKKDEFGTRVFYFYTPEDIKELSPASLKSIYQDIQDLRGQRWFIIILQKT